MDRIGGLKVLAYAVRKFLAVHFFRRLHAAFADINECFGCVTYLDLCSTSDTMKTVYRLTY